MASTAGGMEIEEVAKENPEAILRERILSGYGTTALSRPQEIAFGLGLSSESSSKPPCRSCNRSIALFSRWTLSLVEINPCVATGDGRLVALDAKVAFDDNALYRHPELQELRDLDEESLARSRSLEIQAQLHQARRHHRLHGKWRRPGDGYHGHHQACRWEPRKFFWTSAVALPRNK